MLFSFALKLILFWSFEKTEFSLFLPQARDPSVHAAILAHLNQKYGSGSGQDNSQQTNKEVTRAQTRPQQHEPVLTQKSLA